MWRAFTWWETKLGLAAEIQRQLQRQQGQKALKPKLSSGGEAWALVQMLEGSFALWNPCHFILGFKCLTETWWQRPLNVYKCGFSFLNLHPSQSQPAYILRTQAKPENPVWVQALNDAPSRHIGIYAPCHPLLISTLTFHSSCCLSKVHGVPGG